MWMASSSSPSSNLAIISSSSSSSSSRHYTRQAIHVVRAQSFRDGAGGGSSNRVDANLSVLRGRIEVVKMKEKLERCCRYEEDKLYGWNYETGYNDDKLKGNKKVSELFEVLRLVGATLGFTCFTGTVFLCLVSLFLHFNH